MKNIVFAVLLFLMSGCATYLHDNDRDNRKAPRHDERKDADYQRDRDNHRSPDNYR
ncbi:hypothetical protein [Chlorobium phaeobacteroides]|uniref:hypothetical protein n=1 Tax=Chlorobium phaeobacteroides TaxID=1096 RepID=UPI0002F539C7|nr:hypothetical protein [Chlorobium phaeobacteroides]